MLCSVDYKEKSILNELSFVRRGQPPILNEMLKKEYTGPLPISEEKKKDLLSLLPFIDTRFHQFYKNLPCKSSVSNHEVHPDFAEILKKTSQFC